MATSRENLKGYFNTNDRPTESQFFELIESGVHLEEDKAPTSMVELGSDNAKFVTSVGAKASVLKFAPVKKVNNEIPDSNGNVVITNVSGTASTITGSIAKTQVTGLVTDLNAKQNTLVSGTSIKTINGNSVLGSGNITVGFTRLIAVPSSSFALGNSNSAQTAFPSGCDEITIAADRTYFFRGKYLLATGTAAHTTAIGWALSGGLSVNSMEYTVRTFSSAANTVVSTVSNVQVSGTASKVINASDTSATTIIEFEGVLRCKDSGGVLTPQLTFSAAPGGTNTMRIGSFIEFAEIGNFGVQAVGDVR
ncbi:MAG TPA: hypothetical protein VJL37_11550 [Flavobacterium sp.]|nr:hypothetical protein [Flavobacterium sp.]